MSWPKSNTDYNHIYYLDKAEKGECWSFLIAQVSALMGNTDEAGDDVGIGLADVPCELGIGGGLLLGREGEEMYVERECVCLCMFGNWDG